MANDEPKSRKIWFGSAKPNGGAEKVEPEKKSDFTAPKHRAMYTRGWSRYEFIPSESAVMRIWRGCCHATSTISGKSFSEVVAQEKFRAC